MNHFEEFCKATPKNEHGYVPDVLDMESSAIDQATVAMLRDIKCHYLADNYYGYSNSAKNHYFSQLEHVMQDEVDKLNDKIDYEKELANQSEESYFDDNWKYSGTNAAMFDAGFKSSDFC